MFLFGTIVLMPIMAYIADKFNYSYRGGFLEHYIIFFTQYTDLTGADGSFLLGQFWFLLYLLIISVVGVGIIALLKRFISEKEGTQMSNNYKEIDPKTWKRAVHCEVFRRSIEPAFCVTFELDITNFLKRLRELDYSFTMALIYAVAKCANEIEEFRYRFVDGKVVLFDKIDTAFTYLNKDTELFKVVNVPMQDTMEKYVFAAGKTAAEQKEYFTGPLGNDVFQFSPMPWVSYTHISHTNAGKADNATPLFDWGKYFERYGKVILPFSVQAHHSFVDGIHIGKLADSLQAYLDEI